MKTIPATVLYHEGPIAQAYLAVLLARNLKPQKILKLVYKNNYTTGKPILKWLPRPFRISIAGRFQRAAFNHWPDQLAKTHTALKESIEEYLKSEGLPDAVFSIGANAIDDPRFADSIETLFVDGFSDRVLRSAIMQTEASTVLFTGGGLLPASLLNIAGVKYLHVHPGRLPAVRGADGLLWSQMIRGVPGATCFEMAPGIDLGAIIVKKEFGKFSIPISPHRRPDNSTLYRLVFSFLDPWIRALLLDQLVADHPDMNFETSLQVKMEGVTQNFMHPRLQQIAFSSMFPDQP